MPSVPAIIPYLTVADAAAAIEFYQTALGATVNGVPHLMPNTTKIMNVSLNVAGGVIMMSDDFSDMMHHPCMTPPALGGSPVVIALTIENAQTFWDRAVAGGVTVTMPMKKMFWGQLYGQFTDPFGHRWSVSETVQEMTDAEMQKAAEDEMKDKGSLTGDPIEDEAAA